MTESWITEQNHEDCEYCEAAVELAIEGAKEAHKPYETWTIVTPPDGPQGPPCYHTGKVTRE